MKKIGKKKPKLLSLVEVIARIFSLLRKKKIGKKTGKVTKRLKRGVR